MIPKQHLRHILFIVGSLGLLLSCFLNWIAIVGRGFSLFELGKFAGTWGRYSSLGYLRLIAALYLLIPVIGCIILITLAFRKTSRIITFVGGMYAAILSGILFLPRLPFGLPNVDNAAGIYVAFFSACVLFFGAIFSRKKYEISTID